MPYTFNPFTGNFDYYEAGSGSADLATVLTNGNTSGANDIYFDASQGLYFNNSSRVREGTIDAALGGTKGVALICAVGYEFKWEAGRLYIMDGNGIYIRHSLYNFTVTPTVNDDGTKGYLPGSLWSLDVGDTYLCSDSTTGAAVWTLQSSAVPTLAQVLASGNTANNLDIIDIDKLDFNTATTDTAGEGQLAWNDTLGTLDLGLKGGNTISNLGQHLHARVVNKVTPNQTLTKAGYKAVRVSGAQGQRLAVELAQGNNDTNSADTIGIVCETIATNQEGFIVCVGQIEGINTTGSLQSETWVDGDVLYLSPTTAGEITKVKPLGAGHIVVIGYVEYAHAINGKIYVKVMNGWELDELHDVAITTPVSQDALIYESSTQLWKNKTIGDWNYIVKNANHDVTNTIIPQDDPELQFSVVANGSYMVEMDFCWSGNHATGDYQGNFNVTAGAISGYGLIISSTQTTPILLASNNSVSPSLGNFQLVSTNITFLMSCKVLFNFTCTQNAIFKYQLRNVAASVGAISRTWKGSILKYKKIN